MRPVLTAEQSRAQDDAAQVSRSVLLDRAGFSVACSAASLGVGYGDRVALLVGPGNNGGDGFVAGRYLRQRGVDVDLYGIGEPATSEASTAREAAVNAGARERSFDDVRASTMVIDAFFGGGFHGELPSVDPWRRGVPVVAVDVPSGLSASTGQAVSGVLPADLTVTFHGPKVGHLIGAGPDLVGELRVVDIGLPRVEPELWECETADAPLPNRIRSAHKWSAGSVLVVGGSAGLDGAVTLTARAALAAGAGAVMIACPAVVEERVRAPEIMTRAIGTSNALDTSDVGSVGELADRFDVVVLGPGMGLEAGPFVHELLGVQPGKVLVDADALNVADINDLTRSEPTILTPHGGEFTRLTGNPPGYPEAAELARHTGATVLLKGGPTFVMSPDSAWVVTTGGPELATIGTGDVLAGITAALWASGLDIEVAARSGAFWHGRAGAELQSIRTVTSDRLIDQVAIVTRRRHVSSTLQRRVAEELRTTRIRGELPDRRS